MANDRLSIPRIETALTHSQFGIDPYSTYESLRSEAPVYWSDTLNAWIVSRYSDVVDVLRDWRKFSNTSRVASLLSPFSDRDRFSPLEAHFATGMVHADPPDHTWLRRIVSHAFTNRAVERLRPRVERIVDDPIGAVAASGQINLIADLVYPLPATVIAELRHRPLERLDDLALASSELGWNISGVFRCVKELPFTFTPSSAGARLESGPAH